MGMMINRRRACGGKSLPYDAEIEYLESTGTQWIDTGIHASNYIAVLGRIYLLYDNEGGVYGVRDFVTGNAHAFIQQKYIRAMCFWDETYNSNLPFVATEVWHTIDVKNGVFKIDGNEIYICGTQRRFRSSYTIPIFGTKTGNDKVVSLFGKLRMSEFLIYDNEVLILHLIPVRVGTTGYMYDKVSKQLFGNSGTGSFILGQDK